VCLKINGAHARNIGRRIHTAGCFSFPYDIKTHHKTFARESERAAFLFCCYASLAQHVRDCACYYNLRRALWASPSRRAIPGQSINLAVTCQKNDTATGRLLLGEACATPPHGIPQTPTQGCAMLQYHQCVSPFVVTFLTSACSRGLCPAARHPPCPAATLWRYFRSVPLSPALIVPKHISAVFGGYVAKSSARLAALSALCLTP